MELEALDELYRDIILDHYKNPRHGNDVDNPDLESNGNNPFCGDEISLQLKLSHGRIVEIGFHGRGCSISQASGSIMAGAIEGKSLEEVEKELTKRLPRKQFSSIEDIGNLVAFLCSDASKEITGATIQIDKGLFKGLF